MIVLTSEKEAVKKRLSVHQVDIDRFEFEIKYNSSSSKITLTESQINDLAKLIYFYNDIPM